MAERRKLAAPAQPLPLGSPALASERMRARMVERLRAAGIADEAVLAAIGAVPRHRFVEDALSHRAYEDTALPIGHGQTISQPWIVARMVELARDSGQVIDNVLEIGTGCGYQAAVLALVARQVISVERMGALHELARANLRNLKLPNLRLMRADGMHGAPSAAPFDASVVAAAGLQVPQDLLDQLKVGGRLVAPLGDRRQRLTLVRRTGPSTWSREELDPVRFVPLRPGVV